MIKDRILDKDVTIHNFANFKRCAVASDGKMIKFTMACGINYDVPLDYLVKWFSNPHYFYKEGKLVPLNSSKYIEDFEGNIAIKKCRRIVSRTAVRVYFTNGAVYDVPWDTVLMACENRYEHFGGLTDESKRIVNEWSKKSMKQ